jgi:hypothetical protein
VQVRTSESRNIILVGQFEIAEILNWNTEQLVYKRAARCLLLDSESGRDTNQWARARYTRLLFLHQTSYHMTVNNIEQWLPTCAPRIPDKFLGDPWIHFYNS